MEPCLWISFIPFVIMSSYFLISLAIFPFFYSKIKMSKADLVEERHVSRILNTWFRYWWLWVIGPLFRFFMKSQMSPNLISATGTFLALCAGAVFAFSTPYMGVVSFGLGGWLMVFGGSMDFMDGWVARQKKLESLSGAFFDSCMDRVAECFVFAGLAWYFRGSVILWVVMAALCGSMLTSYAKCCGDKMGAEYSGGIMQRPERVVYVGVGAILAPLIGYFLFLGFPHYFKTLQQAVEFFYVIPLLFVALLSNYTTVDRIKNVMRLLDKKVKNN